MGTQLSLLDLIADDAEPASQAAASTLGSNPAGSPTGAGGDPRVAAARASLGRAVQRRGQPAAVTTWTAVRLDADTCELGRRRVARAREVIDAARRRAEAQAQAGASARQRAALAGAISAEQLVDPEDALPLPARRIRRSSSAA